MRVTIVLFVVTLATTVTAQPYRWERISGLPDVVTDVLHAPDGAVWTVSASSVFRSSDFGVHWADRTPFLAGGVRSACITPTGTVVVASNTGVYRSDDNGITWPLAFKSPKDPHAFYVGSGPGGLVVTQDYGIGIVISSDNGRSWDTVKYADEATITSIVCPADGSIMMSEDGNGVVRSTDRGATWTPMNTGITTIFIYELTADPSGALCARGRSTCFRSTDGAHTWTDVGAANGLLLVHDAANGTLLGTANSGLYRSNDRGATWTRIAGVNGGVRDVWSNGSTILAAGDSTFVSGDGGASWSNTTRAIKISWVKRLVEVAPHNLLMTGGGYNIVDTPPITGHGVFRSSDDGLTWTSLGGAFINDTIENAVQDNRGDLYIVQGYDIYRSTDGGGAWTHIPHPDIAYVPTLYLNHAGDVLGPLWNLSDDRSRFVLLDLDTVTIRPRDGLGISNVALYGDDRFYAITNFDTVYALSLDAGTRRTHAVQINAPLATRDFIRCDNGAFLAGEFVRDNTPYNFAVSTDNGVTWKPGPLHFHSMTSAISIGAEIIVFGIQYDSTERTWYYSAIHTLDGGSTWETYDLGLTRTERVFQSIRLADGNVLLGTDGGTVYRLNRQGITGVADLSVAAVPSQFEMHVYPNPTTASAIVTMHVDHGAPCTCSLVDALGRTVRAWTIASTGSAPASHALDFTALPAGMYRCHAVQGAAEKSCPVLVVR